jgi:allantoinase
MDHAHYDYSAVAFRENPFIDKTIGVLGTVILYLEHWEFIAPKNWRRDPRWVGEFGSFFPDYRTWSQREYGLRVGIFRVIQALGDAGIKPAIAANSMALERLPNLVKIFNELDCEWIGHGIAINHMMHSKMALHEQEQYIKDSLDTVERMTGKKPKGWISQDWGSSVDTLSLLSKKGIEYTMDWPNDDQPYLFKSYISNAGDKLLSIPLSSEFDDVQTQWFRNLSAQSFATICVDGLNQLSREFNAKGTQSIFALGLHPWLCGMPNRIKYLKQTLKDIGNNSSVRWVSPSDIKQAYNFKAFSV